ncbi:hypothetical protein CDAR_393941 [Caerostris darwini]|uniref:Uncharacterized protein n=1 Tax=Caerostris darwini TaxID=1538125 RepID=A0AAV4SYQ5_9ARAC|nr:hypothetical protein CDAR_393941 [Caerostris darwini]
MEGIAVNFSVKSSFFLLDVRDGSKANTSTARSSCFDVFSVDSRAKNSSLSLCPGFPLWRQRVLIESNKFFFLNENDSLTRMDSGIDTDSKPVRDFRVVNPVRLPGDEKL